MDTFGLFRNETGSEPNAFQFCLYAVYNELPLAYFVFYFIV